MNSETSQALLPAGLTDLLPPEAGHSAETVERLLACFAGRGYERVKPPLIEFEDQLLHGSAAALARDTFRLMDPVSQQMMGLRADITMQVARIAASRLTKSPRPLRLCYAGDVFRVKGAQLRPERQFTQVGFELVGAPSAAADVETVLLAASALHDAGVERLSVDLSLPTLVPVLCAGIDLAENASAALRQALDLKDAGAVATSAGKHAALFCALLAAAGPASQALKSIEALKLPDSARKETQRLAEVTRAILAAQPGLSLTIDPVENRGFEYHTGVGFTIFAPGVRGELGSGGRYLAGALPSLSKGDPEPATGGTLYLETILRALPNPIGPRRLFLPFGTKDAEGQAHRDAGWITLSGLDKGLEAEAEARRLGCSHLLVGDEAIALVEKDD